MRIHPKTGEKYVGQAKSGQCLDRLEEDHIKLQGGIKSRRGPLANKRHQMSEPRYRAEGGKIPMPY